MLNRRQGGISYGGSMPGVLLCPSAPAKPRAVADVNKAIGYIAAEEVREDSNIKVGVGKAGLRTTESGPVVAANPDAKITKGEEEAIAKVR